MPDDIGIDLDCSVCGTDQVVHGLDPVQLEHVLDIWARQHAHTASEREAWYRSDQEDAMRGDE